MYGFDHTEEAESQGWAHAVLAGPGSERLKDN